MEYSYIIFQKTDDLLSKQSDEDIGKQLVIK